MAIFEGSGVAIITPFRDGKVDFDSLGELLDWQVEEGTDAIVICGTTGEVSALTQDEQIDTIAYTVKRIDGRIPVIAGTGSNHTDFGVITTKRAEAVGADAVLMVTPYYNKATKKGLLLHYEAMAGATKLPVLLYSVPARTGVNITPDIAFELSKIDNIVGLKEASGDMAQVVEIARRVPEGFDLYSGNDEITVPVLSVGGKGVISVLANVAPKATHDMVRKFLDGDVKGSAELQLKTKPLIDALFSEVSPVPVKAALSMMGKINYEYRLPLCQMEANTYEKLITEMKTFGIL